MLGGDFRGVFELLWQQELEECEKEGDVEGMAEAKEQITVWQTMTEEEHYKQNALEWNSKIEEWKKNGVYDNFIEAAKAMEKKEQTQLKQEANESSEP